jgi:phosphoglycolate phosphatase
VARYRLVMFDFDGTLADTFPYLLQTFDQVADRFRFRRRDPDATEAMRGLDTRAIMRHHGVATWKLPFIARHARALMAARIDQFRLFEGVAPALNALADHGVILALVTSNARSNAATVLGPALLGRFAHVECGISMFGKASRLRRLLKRCRVTAANALFVGDELRDADAAHAARVSFGAVGWGYARLDALLQRQPQEVFQHPTELARLVEPSN